MIFGLGELPITFIGMITHGHGDEGYVQYSNELWSNDPNFTIGSLLHFFLTLEKAQVSDQKILFKPSIKRFFCSSIAREIMLHK